jgi:hypothetical protein
LPQFAVLEVPLDLANRGWVERRLQFLVDDGLVRFVAAVERAGEDDP